MSAEQNTPRESEEEQYCPHYPVENKISIDILTDDCLGYVFKFLPFVDRARTIERGKYSTLHV